MTPEHLKNGTCMQDAKRYAAHPDHALHDVPWQALLKARQALRDAQLTNDADDYEMIGPVADAILAAGLKVIFEEDTEHLMQIKTDGSWVIQHPLSCRPNLFACPLTARTVFKLDYSWTPGVFVVTCNDAGELVLGDRKD